MDKDFKHIFENCDDPIVKYETVDGKAVIIEVNDAFVDVFGDGSESVIGESLTELVVPPAEQSGTNGGTHPIETGDSNTAIIDRITSDGKRSFLYRDVLQRDRFGVAIYTDITDEVQREQHLKTLQRLLRHNFDKNIKQMLEIADEIIQTTEDPETKHAAMKIKQVAGKLTDLTE